MALTHQRSASGVPSAGEPWRRSRYRLVSFRPKRMRKRDVFAPLLHLPRLSAVEHLVDPERAPIRPYDRQQVDTPFIVHVQHDVDVHFVHASSFTVFRHKIHRYGIIERAFDNC